jgi:type II restriction enzyme
MLLDCDLSFATGYHSKSQIARVLSEGWFRDNAYCLSCENNQLLPTAANTKVSDFVCDECRLSYELKSFRNKPVTNLVDGAYSSMLFRIQGDSVPVLMLLETTDAWKIRSLTAIHYLFLTPEVIIKRKPLSSTARRAGWIGCNIRLDLIASDAQIQVVKEGVPIEPNRVRQQFQRFNTLKSIQPNSRGWTTLTLRALQNLKLTSFSIEEVYAQESIFAAAYPDNNNIRAKIRQQLQVLRDLGYVEFCGRGNYRLLI